MAGVVITLRARPATRAAVPVAAAVPTEGGAALTVLDEPAGTRVAAVVAAGPRLALSLQGGGPDRVVLLDPASGTVTRAGVAGPLSAIRVSGGCGAGAVAYEAALAAVPFV